jgi:hypothetical protein
MDFHTSPASKKHAYPSGRVLRIPNPPLAMHERAPSHLKKLLKNADINPKNRIAEAPLP